MKRLKFRVSRARAEPKSLRVMKPGRGRFHASATFDTPRMGLIDARRHAMSDGVMKPGRGRFHASGVGSRDVYLRMGARVTGGVLMVAASSIIRAMRDSTAYTALAAGAAAGVSCEVPPSRAQPDQLTPSHIVTVQTMQAKPRERDEAVVEGFKLSASLVSATDRIAPTEPVLLKVRIENAADEMLYFFHARPMEDFELRVAHAADGEVPLTWYGVQLAEARASPVVRGRGIRRLRPGDHMEDVLHVDRAHDMSLAGAYTIRASRSVPKREFPGHVRLLRPHATVWSQRVHVEVVEPPGD